jgi:hypothetical protein
MLYSFSGILVSSKIKLLKFDLITVVYLSKVV